MKLFLKMIIATMFLLTTYYANAAYESVGHGVNNYGGTGECSGSDRQYTQDFLDIWEDRFEDDFGYPTYYVRQWINKQVDHVDFDSSDYNYPYGTDWADAIMFLGHGGIDGSNDSVRLVLGEGTTWENCRIHFDSELSLGEGGGGTNGDANAFVNFMCHGGEKAVWNNNGMPIRGGSQFNIYNAFHGSHWRGPNEGDVFDDYLNISEYNNVGLRWVTDLTRKNSGGSQNCAVWISWASDSADNKDNYRYSGYKDFHSTGSGVRYYSYVRGCDPAGSTGALPN